MSKLWHVLKHESLQLIGPTCFFFVAFNVIMFTKKLFLEDYHINFGKFFLPATIGALLVGLAASLYPAISAARLDPTIALRSL